jgi:hypothetical protein
MGFERLFKQYYKRCQNLKNRLVAADCDREKLRKVRQDFTEMQRNQQRLVSQQEKALDAARKNAKTVSDFGRVLKTIKKINPGVFDKAFMEMHREDRMKKQVKAQNKRKQVKADLFIVRDTDG